MPAYLIPKVKVWQEFTSRPTELGDLPAFITGPHFDLIRYSDADEKDSGSLGAYDPDTPVTHDGPNKAAGVVDLTYTEVFIDDAMCRYYNDSIGSGSVWQGVLHSPNQVRAASLVLRTANGYTRSGVFYDRDVAVGDYVILTQGGVSQTSYIMGFVADQTASVVGAATADSNNKNTQSSACSITQSAGAVNNISATPECSDYNGVADGDLSETYTVTVLTGGAPSEAVLSVTSGSGNDNDAGLTPSAWGVATAVGTRGATVTFSNTYSSSSSGNDNPTGSVDNDDVFVAGQTWILTVAQTWAEPVITSGGAYTGATDTTYVVEVMTGSLFADSDPIVEVRTTTGVDASGPHTVTAAGTTVSIGTAGVTITIGAGAMGLCTGDKYYVQVTAAADAQVRTVVLAHNLRDEFLNAGLGVSSSSSLGGQIGPDMRVQLFIKKDIEVTEDRTELPPLKNWTPSANSLWVNRGITTFDSSWTNGGTLLPLQVRAGNLYVTYRTFTTAHCSGISSIKAVSQTEVEAVLGPASVDNPLSLAVWKACQNANYHRVYYLAVCPYTIGDAVDELEAYNDVIEVLKERPDLYSLVPLTKTATVIAALKTFLEVYDEPDQGQWYSLWTNVDVTDPYSVMTTTNSGTTLLGTIEDNPNVAGTQYTRMVLADANLTTRGVQVGDLVRYGYGVDGFGQVSYDTGVVASVVNEETLLLVSGASSAVTVASKVEIWRAQTSATLRTTAVSAATTQANSRIRVVFPDQLGNGGVTMSGVYLCAALAGLRSGVHPHQGLTNVEISGFDDLSRVTEDVLPAHLDTMAENGVWIVTQDPNSDLVYTRHALTSDVSDLNVRDEQLISNVDSISRYMKNRLSGFIGRTNVAPSNMSNIVAEFRATKEYLKSAGFTPELGPQLIDATLTEPPRAHSTLVNTVVMVVQLTVPRVMDYLEVHLVI